MNYTGERAIPWNSAVGGRIMHHHVMRYAWALQFVESKKIVDLGCGCGYGSFMLSWTARRVVGVDVDLPAIKFAGRHFQAPNLQFCCLDITGGRGFTADLFVAFEVLEHLDHPMMDLADYRPLFYSVPIGDASRFHKRAYTVHEVDQEIGMWSHMQLETGEIVPRERVWKDPKYVLGILSE